MKGPLDIHQYLLAHDVHHEIVRLPRSPNGNSGANLAQALGLPARRCVDVHAFHALTRSSDTLVLLLAPSDTVIDDAAVGQRLARAVTAITAISDDAANGSRAANDVAVFTRAGAQLVSSRTDYLAGHVAPLLLPPDVHVVALQSLADLAATVVYTPTGDIGTALGMRALDLIVLSRAIVLPAGERATRRRPVRIDLDPAHVLIDAGDEPPAHAVPVRRAPAARRPTPPRPAAITPVAS
jgi:hypothetical protein